jgi:tRNA A64-2'-O-ribosylphosphate transferase
MPDPLSPSQLIFPGTSSFHSSLKQISHASLTVSNRLRSIQHDSIFISQVSEAYQLPLVANERCGNWYIPLSQKAGSAYFKSTDGHNGEWAFSLRRLNVQIFHLIGGNGG